MSVNIYYENLINKVLNKTTNLDYTVQWILKTDKDMKVHTSENIFTMKEAIQFATNANSEFKMAVHWPVKIINKNGNVEYIKLNNFKIEKEN